MFYKLKPQYMLRGWKLLPTGLINRETRKFRFLPGKKFDVLKMCTGILDSQSFLFNDEQRKIMEELRADGYVDANENPSLIEDGQDYKFYDNRFMQSAHWAITGKCNCRCRHCYMSAPQHKVEELTHEQCMDIIAQMADCGIQTVSLTGGEVLVRKDFWEIIDALTAADIKISSILTNGLLVNENFIAELERRNLRPQIQISFDGVNGCHDWVRGVAGAEQLVYRALELLHEKNFYVKISFSLHRDNAPYLRETVNKMASFGVRYFCVTAITDCGEASGMTDKILSTDERYDICLDYIPQYIEDGAPLPLNLSALFEAENTSEYSIPLVRTCQGGNIDKRFVCYSMRNAIYIDFDGVVVPCPPISIDDSSKKIFSRIFDKPLKESLNDGAYMKFINTRLGDYFAANPQCAACEYKNRCASGCRGNAMEKNRDGNLLGVDKDTCKFFKGGYYDKVIALGEKLHLKRIGA